MVNMQQHLLLLEMKSNIKEEILGQVNLVVANDLRENFKNEVETNIEIMYFDLKSRLTDQLRTGPHKRGVRKMY
jgi:hypothetical protein